MVKLKFKWSLKWIFSSLFIVLFFKWTYMLDTGYFHFQQERHLQILDKRKLDPFLSPSRENDALPETISIPASVQMISDNPNITFVYPWKRVPRGDKVYNRSDFPSVSVVISFHDKELVTDIIHTVHSIFQRSPVEFLREVILVDDNSQKYELTTVLPGYMESFSPKVRIIRSEQSLGLIQARHMGIVEAEGQVVVVMDSHMEVQMNWLDSLLDVLVREWDALVSSYLDWIEVDGKGQITYKTGGSNWKTYFDWNLKFGFQEISTRDKRNSVEPISTPMIVGTIWAMWKSFYLEVGGMDTGMQGWGGENIELPIKVWLFGGKVYNVPCSHAAHIERLGSRAYRAGGSWKNKIDNNYKRLVDVWFDTYTDVFYHYNPFFDRKPAINITKQLAHKRRAKYDFHWYLQHVYPELGVYNGNSFGYGGLQNKGADRCVTAYPGSAPYLARCNSARVTTQGFFLSVKGELRFPVHVFNVRGYNEYTYTLVAEGYVTAYSRRKNTKWIHSKGGLMVLYPTRFCLAAKDPSRITFMKCNLTDVQQQWQFLCYTADYENISHIRTETHDDTRASQDYLSELSKTLATHDSIAHESANSSRNCHTYERTKW